MENSNHDSNHLKKLLVKNPFDEYIREVDKTIIPQEFVQLITVHYNDGTKVDLKGKDVIHDVVLQYSRGETIKGGQKIADVKVYVDTVKLEEVVDGQIDELFSKFNIL